VSLSELQATTPMASARPELTAKRFLFIILAVSRL
jgi:hypothetical protein